MRNASCVRAARTTRRQKPTSILMETAILEILIMTALFGWVGCNFAYKDMSLPK
jgi:hypothetical protein